MSQVLMLVLMINLIGIAVYANERNSLSGSKQKIINFFCPLGSLLGVFLFKYDIEESWVSLTIGFIFIMVLLSITNIFI